MAIPYFKHDGRRPHKWKIRKEGLRDLFILHRWGLRGGYASKFIKGREVMCIKYYEADDSDYAVYQFMLKDNFWADITTNARKQEMADKRSKFHLVKSG